MIWRKVAQAAGAGFIENFDQFWPLKANEAATPSWSATPVELRKQILTEWVTELKNR